MYVCMYKKNGKRRLTRGDALAPKGQPSPRPAAAAAAATTAAAAATTTGTTGSAEARHI